MTSPPLPQRGLSAGSLWLYLPRHLHISKAVLGMHVCCTLSIVAFLLIQEIFFLQLCITVPVTHQESSLTLIVPGIFNRLIQAIMYLEQRRGVWGYWRKTSPLNLVLLLKGGMRRTGIQWSSEKHGVPLLFFFNATLLSHIITPLICQPCADERVEWKDECPVQFVITQTEDVFPLVLIVPLLMISPSERSTLSAGNNVMATPFHNKCLQLLRLFVSLRPVPVSFKLAWLLKTLLVCHGNHVLSFK